MPKAYQRIAFFLLISGLIMASSCLTVTSRYIKRLARRSPEVLYYIETKTPVIALTIDDGPDPVVTSEILNVLKRNGTRATFFIITSRIQGNEPLLERIAAENHEIGNHLVYDEPSIRLSPDEFERQLIASHKLLSAFAPIHWFRPGSGRYNDCMLATLTKHGYKCALGSVYPFDPYIPWSWFSAYFILRNTQPGSIIVLHDYGSKGERTVKTLAKILPELKRRGFKLVTLSDLASLGANLQQ